MSVLSVENTNVYFKYAFLLHYKRLNTINKVPENNERISYFLPHKLFKYVYIWILKANNTKLQYVLYVWKGFYNFGEQNKARNKQNSLSFYPQINVLYSLSSSFFHFLSHFPISLLHFKWTWLTGELYPCNITQRTFLFPPGAFIHWSN